MAAVAVDEWWVDGTEEPVDEVIGVRQGDGDPVWEGAVSALLRVEPGPLRLAGWAVGERAAEAAMAHLRRIEAGAVLTRQARRFLEGRARRRLAAASQICAVIEACAARRRRRTRRASSHAR